MKIQILECPVTVKLRTGKDEKAPDVHRKIIPFLKEWGVSAAVLHGRSRQQRYTKLADWNYISQCAKSSPVPLIGNGDIFSFEDYYRAIEGGVTTTTIARGALIKPWLLTEIKERRYWDISASERLDLIRDFTNFGLEHWGSDTKGVTNTRMFLCQWLSFTYR